MCGQLGRTQPEGPHRDGFTWHTPGEECLSRQWGEETDVVWSVLSNDRLSGSAKGGWGDKVGTRNGVDDKFRV